MYDIIGNNLFGISGICWISRKKNMMSTNTIIATVVVLLILAALGWMLWKRNQTPNDSEDQINEEVEESAELESENTELVDAMQTNPVFEYE